MDLAKKAIIHVSKGARKKKDPEKSKPKVHGQSRGYKRLLRQLKLRTVRYWRVASGPASRAVDNMQLYEGIILAAASGLWATACNYCITAGQWTYRIKYRLLRTSTFGPKVHGPGLARGSRSAHSARFFLF